MRESIKLIEDLKSQKCKTLYDPSSKKFAPKKHPVLTELSIDLSNNFDNAKHVPNTTKAKHKNKIFNGIDYASYFKNKQSFSKEDEDEEEETFEVNNPNCNKGEDAIIKNKQSKFSPQSTPKSRNMMNKNLQESSKENKFSSAVINLNFNDSLNNEEDKIIRIANQNNINDNDNDNSATKTEKLIKYPDDNININNNLQQQQNNTEEDNESDNEDSDIINQIIKNTQSSFYNKENTKSSANISSVNENLNKNTNEKVVMLNSNLNTLENKEAEDLIIKSDFDIEAEENQESKEEEETVTSCEKKKKVKFSDNMLTLVYEDKNIVKNYDVIDSFGNIVNEKKFDYMKYKKRLKNADFENIKSILNKSRALNNNNNNNNDKEKGLNKLNCLINECENEDLDNSRYSSKSCNLPEISKIIIFIFSFSTF